MYAKFGGISGSDGRLRALLGGNVCQVFARATAAEGSRAYQAFVTSIGGMSLDIRVVRLALADDAKASLPTIEQVELLTLK